MKINNGKMRLDEKKYTVYHQKHLRSEVERLKFKFI